ncbi:hypothetical protein JW916_14595 [Candidatus Sumerlaeota bacterium]|nr:hypothetical protein [Candidatus Sumerlaeota bacterium]
MDGVALRKRIGYEEFDYQMLVDALREYARPRDKITTLLRKGVVVRVKKGLYVFGEDYRRQPVSREILANLMYGPSYVSLEYALHYHGLTPERVETLTSVTCGRARSFATPIGSFSYKQIPTKAFQTGMDRVELDDGRSFLIATRGKALADKLVADRGANIRSQKELRDYLLDNLRVDPIGLRELDPACIADIAKRYRSRKVKMLGEVVGHLRRECGKN